MWHRHEVAAREQIAAYLPWIGLVEVGRLFAKRTREDALPIFLAMTAWGFLSKREKWSQAAAAPAQSGK